MKNKLINWILSGTIGMLLIHGTGLLYTKLAPSSVWFEYESVEPIKPVFSYSEPLVFVSTSTVNKPTTLKWNDILRCEFESRDLFFSSYQSSFTFNKGSYTFRSKVEKPWQYLAQKPNFDSTCYLVSNISATTDYGVDKRQTITSSKFQFKHEL